MDGLAVRTLKASQYGVRIKVLEMAKTEVEAAESEWAIQTSFDSAAECEQARSRKVEDVLKHARNKDATKSEDKLRCFSWRLSALPPTIRAWRENKR